MTLVSPLPVTLSPDATPAGVSGDLVVRYDCVTSGAGPAGTREVRLAIPCLGGEFRECLPPVGGDLLMGAELLRLDQGTASLEQVTLETYRRVLAQVGDRRLCRIWNYVPAINAVTDGLEHYRAFCRGRARAFEAGWGSEFTRQLPAASAVGGPEDVLAVIYALAPGAARPVENPEQVPAYAYPPQHGPRSPSFCRATCAAGLTCDWVFVSGTASIKGHLTVSPGRLEPQIATTLDNLRLVSLACDLGTDLGRSAGWRRQFKIYLRHARDFALARTHLERDLLRPGDTCVWLEAEICRSDLEIEIEATVWRRRESDTAR